MKLITVKLKLFIFYTIISFDHKALISFIISALYFYSIMEKAFLFASSISIMKKETNFSHGISELLMTTKISSPRPGWNKFTLCMLNRLLKRFSSLTLPVNFHSDDERKFKSVRRLRNINNTGHYARKQTPRAHVHL